MNLKFSPASVQKIKDNQNRQLWHCINNEEAEGNGTVSFTSTIAHNLGNYTIYGNSVQTGTPSATTACAITSAGDYINNKYKFNITVTGVETPVTIELTEPLRKVGDYCDYIDWILGKIVRNVKEVTVNSGTNSFDDALSGSAYLCENMPAGNFNLRTLDVSAGITGSKLLYQLATPVITDIDLPAVGIPKSNQVTIAVESGTVSPSKFTALCYTNRDINYTNEETIE